MTITINTEPILLEIRQKSHLEVQDIQDPEARDNARAGLDKMDEIRRCLEDGISQVRRRCLRFLRNEYAHWADDTRAVPESYVFDFSMSERRSLGKAQPLTDAMHDLAVQYALSKFYATVNQKELSNKHSVMALEAGRQIDELLYEKLPPRL